MKDTNEIKEILDKLPNDIEGIKSVLNNNTDEELQTIRNACTDIMPVYFGSLSDYEALYIELCKYGSTEQAEKYVNIIKSVDLISEERNEVEAQDRLTHGYGR